MKILLAESILRKRIEMANMLSEHQVELCNSLAEFEDKFSPEYDVIIMDLDMLGEMAIDCANLLDAASSSIKVIATYENCFKNLKGYLFTAMLFKTHISNKLLTIINKEKVNVKRFHSKTRRPITWCNPSYGVV